MLDKSYIKLSIRRQSELLRINRTTIYYEKVESEDESQLANMISEIYAKYPIYGYRRITAILRKEGLEINHKKVQRIMKLLNIQAIYPKPNTSKNAEDAVVYPYLLGDMSITSSNQVWQTDITYLRTKSGFMYLVAILDVYSRKVLSYRLSNNLGADMCILALEDAIMSHGIPNIVNSDQGSQYTGTDWLNLLSKYGIKVSMTGKGRCCDNIYIERLWRSFKYEGSYLYKWSTISELKENIPRWIKWYNSERPHQSLSYKTPDEVYRFVDETAKSAANWLTESLFADFATTVPNKTVIN